ncbi:acetyl-CoA carboxylase biotin carboxyl carrier protein subunit, partial [Planococcus sp. APC 4015]|nr:acetyl-CoA carboxylase biotin carboxyl carrier protein subunit [Planococcus sp. APC 4015]
TDAGAIVRGAPPRGAAPAAVAAGSTRTSARVVGYVAPDRAPAAVDDDGAIWIHVEGATHRLRPVSRREAMELRLAARETATATSHPELRAPMPGAIVALHAAEGSRVAAGDRVVTIEAMKMEHPVLAPHDGILQLDVSIGDQVRRDQVLARVTADASTSSATGEADSATGEPGSTTLNADSATAG